MDIDQYILRNEASWERLRELTRRARRSPAVLSEDELDELVMLYQRTSTQLSHVRTHYRDGPLTVRLTKVVAEARGAVYSRRGRGARSLVDFLVWTFPAAVWGARRAVVVSTLLLMVPALVIGTWIAVSEEALEATADPAVREAYLQEDFEAYYSSAPAAQFSTEVLINNIQVSFLAFALGIVFCLGTVYVLMLNGANIGLAAGLFHAAGEAPKFWGLVLPHGLLELAAVAVAGAAGLRLGWAVISPGERARRAALGEEGRRSVVIILGLMLAFVVAGIIEGFVTPSPLSTAVRIAIGILAFVVFALWIVVQGRRAEAAGLTGAWGERPTGAMAGRTSAEGTTVQSRPVALTSR